MKKRYGIGFLCGTILLTLILVCAYQFSYHRAREKERQTLKTEQEYAMPTEGKLQKEDSYLIKEKDGYVIVYFSDGKTVYEYTSIEVQYLPEQVKQEIKNGKRLEDAGQVYGFLENYSS